jgi:hypothetical protein
MLCCVRNNIKKRGKSSYFLSCGCAALLFGIESAKQGEIGFLTARSEKWKCDLFRGL